jgi:nucleotide-binding universal stress UspA family protein
LPVQVTWSAVLGEQSGALQSDVAAAIIRVAETGEAAEGLGPASRCDLVGMATHGRGGVRRWALGSITDRVLHASGLPTLVVPPRGAESSPPVSEP